MSCLYFFHFFSISVKQIALLLTYDAHAKEKVNGTPLEHLNAIKM